MKALFSSLSKSLRRPDSKIGPQPRTTNKGTATLNENLAQLSSSEAGLAAEQLCERYLVSQGWTLVQRNFSCKCGEVDLIVKKDALLVFVEVRYRKQASYGSAAASVTLSKQKKLLATVQFFLQCTPGFSPTGSAFRIDVMQVSPRNKSGPTDADVLFQDHLIRWIPNAIVG